MKNQSVSFTSMAEGTKEDYEHLGALEMQFVQKTPERIMQHLAKLEDSLSGYKITRLEHSLQSAARAEADGADIDWIVSALLHDIGDDLAPHNHDSLAACVLAPYVREQCSWVVRHHGVFQLVYYAHHTGDDPNEHKKYKDSPYYDSAVYFCKHWDQCSFDPSYDTPSLEHFRPMVETVFTRKPWENDILLQGVVVPLSAAL